MKRNVLSSNYIAFLIFSKNLYSSYSYTYIIINKKLLKQTIVWILVLYVLDFSCMMNDHVYCHYNLLIFIALGLLLQVQRQMSRRDYVNTDPRCVHLVLHLWNLIAVWLVESQQIWVLHVQFQVWIILWNVYIQKWTQRWIYPLWCS